MELDFIFASSRFSESHNAYNNDFRVKIDAITSYYKLNSEIRTIRIKIGGNNPDEFLKKMNNIDPKITFLDGSSWIYHPIEKIKDKIK